MPKPIFKIAILAIYALSFTSCNDDADRVSTPIAVSKEMVVANYADMAYANYKQAYDDAVLLEAAINAFTDNPTDNNFILTKNAWKTSRESYGTTEAFRFSNGPIDDENDVESLINSWPLDENYIDYTDGGAGDSVINNLGIPITKESLAARNGVGGEDRIYTGYHAIEFLLWGQDLTLPAANLPGQRPYTDYVTGGTHDNQARRAQFLKVCADLLTDNLYYVVEQWSQGGAYRTMFLAMNQDTAIQNIFLGIATLSQSELAIERMKTALLSESQENEHSCFSDNTHRDIRLNLDGIANIWEGKYGNIAGPSLSDLVAQADVNLAAQIEAALNAAHNKMELTGIPFDNAISGGQDSVEGAKILTAINALDDLGAYFIAGAAKLGITVNVSL